MHALVLQEARGEVAAIDLVSRVVVDTNPAIPGYTFVPVDPLPTGILVPPTAPTCAFVSSAGAETIDAIDLRIFRRESRASAVLHDPLLLPGAPAAMVLDPSEEALWVAMPDRSSVARVAIDGCRFGEVEEIRLETTVPPGRVAPPEDDDPTSRYCPADFGAAELPSITARAPEGLEDVARPAALAITGSISTHAPCSSPCPSAPPCGLSRSRPTCHARTNGARASERVTSMRSTTPTAR
jgi:hypothetical protein